MRRGEIPMVGRLSICFGLWTTLVESRATDLGHENPQENLKSSVHWRRSRDRKIHSLVPLAQIMQLFSCSSTTSLSGRSGRLSGMLWPVQPWHPSCPPVVQSSRLYLRFAPRFVPWYLWLGSVLFVHAWVHRQVGLCCMCASSSRWRGRSCLEAHTLVSLLTMTMRVQT